MAAAKQAQKTLSDGDLQQLTCEAAKLAAALESARRASGMMAAILSDAQVPHNHPLYKAVDDMHRHVCDERYLTVAQIIRAAT